MAYRLLTLKEGTAPSNWISDQPLALHQIHDVPYRQVVSTFGILGEHVLELLWNETTFGVVGSSVAAMFILVNVLDVDSEERIGEERGLRWV